MRFSAPTGFQPHRALRTPRHRSRRRRCRRGVAGWGVASRIGRTTRRPRATWVIIATAATGLSLSMPFPGHGVTVTQRVALACMHLAVAAVLIPVFAATSRRSTARPGRTLRACLQVTSPGQPAVRSSR